MSDEQLTVQPEWYLLAKRTIDSVWRAWGVFLTFSLVGGIIALVATYVLPASYRAGAAFQAEAAPSGQLGGGLSSALNAIPGLQIGGTTSALLLGDLLKTDAVLRRVIQDSFPWKDGRVSLAKIYGYDRKADLVRDYRTVNKLRKAIAVDVDIRTSIVRFSVEARTPELTRALAQALIAAIDTANIRLRQERARAERAFTAERSDEARQELGSAEGLLAMFHSRNRVIAGSPLLELEEARLKRQVDIAQQLYLQLRLQEEQAAIQELRATPSISVIDPPVLPVKPTWPRRKLAVIAGLIVGFSLALTRLLLKGKLSAPKAA
jgi:uncharacterized protein involved in exopolysaccharide biosynthesis